MALNIQRILTGIQIIGVGSSNISQAGEIEYLNSINKLQIHNGTSISPFVTEDHQATINNKLLIDATVLFANQSDITKKVQFDLSGVPTGTTLVFAIPPAGGTVVTENGTQTLSNKSLVDNSTFVIDNGDATKRFKFEASGITTATTRTLTIQDQDTTLVGRDTTDNLTNKSLIDSSTWIIDEGDNTKKLQFQVSGITTATTRTLTVPDANTTIVGTDVAQVLSNKTLDDATTLIQDNSDNTKKFRFEASSISTSTTRVLTVPDATDTLVVAAFAQTLTNKTFTDSTTFFQDEGDNTKKLQFQLSGITTATTRTLTIPDANTTIVGTDATQIITNKDIDGGTASNAHRLTLPKDTFANLNALTRKEGTIWYATDQVKPYFDTGSTLLPIGSGSGSGGRQAISNSDFETDVTGWNTYADAAGVAPVNGTGGSPNVTFTRTTSSPLNGTGSGLLTKDAANRQGQGVSTDFTIPREDQGKVHTIQVNYEPSANFVPGSDFILSDIGVWVYDVTNGVLIQPAPYKLTSGATGAPWRYIGQFQTQANSVSYRLILHIGTTNANAWTVKVDDITVTPNVTVVGPPVLDWQDYSLIIGATTTAPTPGTTSINKARWRRVGDSMEVEYHFVQTSAGSSGSGIYLFPLPGNYQIDTNKLPVSTDGKILIDKAVASNTADGQGPTTSPAYVVPYNASNLAILRHADTAGSIQTTLDSFISSATFGLGATANVIYNFKCTIPILGWSAGLEMSQDADTRVVAAYAGMTTSTAFLSDTPIIFDTEVFDTHNAYNPATGGFTVPVPGKYRVTFTALSTSGGASTVVRKNATNSGYLATFTNSSIGSGSHIIDCVAGDVLYVVTDSNITVTGTAGPNFFSSASFERLSGPAIIAQTDRIVAVYSRQGAGNTTPGSGNPIDFSIKQIDTHNAVTTGASWKFTAPVPGIYFASITQNGNVTGTIFSYKNGSTDTNVVCSVGNTAGDAGSLLVQLNAGDFIDFRDNCGATYNSGIISIYLVK